MPLNRYKCWNDEYPEPELPNEVNACGMLEAAEIFTELRSDEGDSPIYVRVKRLDFPQVEERVFYVQSKTTWEAVEVERDVDE